MRAFILLDNRRRIFEKSKVINSSSGSTEKVPPAEVFTGRKSNPELIFFAQNTDTEVLVVAPYFHAPTACIHVLVQLLLRDTH